MYQIGVAKTDITTFKKGTTMLGYGMEFNTVEGIETRLYARAFVIKAKEDIVCIVNCELCFITPSLKRGVLELLNEQHPKIRIADSNLVLCAQHTHSGPAGFSHHPFYNIITPGFLPEVYDFLCTQIATAIVEASNSMQKGSIHFGESGIAADKQVAFNRSLEAYNANKDVEKISYENRHLAVNRNMSLLRFTDASGKDIGSINWFGVHTTSLPNTNHKINADNKGYAAKYLESDFEEGYVGAFAQGICGDVTSRFVFNPMLPKHRGFYEGKYPNDIESAKFNGKIQYEKSRDIIDNDAVESLKHEKVSSILDYSDFADISVNEDFTNGLKNVKTSAACLGVSFLEGSKVDGPGASKALGNLSKLMMSFLKIGSYFTGILRGAEFRKYNKQKFASQGKKYILIETGDRKLLATRNIKRVVIPGGIDAAIGNFKHYHRVGALADKPWTPQILPLQLVQIGSVILAAIPFEITTVAAQRLTKTIEDVLLDKDGIEKIVLCPYSNAYNGYVTTYEEYQLQLYEGGHTVFGEYTLAALQTEIKKLALNFLINKEGRVMNNAKPVEFSKEELDKMAYFEK